MQIPEPLIYIGTTILVVVAIMRLVMVRNNRRLKGKFVSSIYALATPAQAQEENLVVYCYSPHCGPCHSMTPVVDKLALKSPAIIKLNVLEHSDIAHDLGIMGTPTLVHLVRGRIGNIMAGAQSEKKIRKFLHSPSP